MSAPTNDDLVAELSDGRVVLVARAGQTVTDELLERLGLDRSEVKRRGDTTSAIPEEAGR